MRMPRLNETERAVFAALYAHSLAMEPRSIDNTAHEDALEQALWGVQCFRQALRDREEDR